MKVLVGLLALGMCLGSTNLPVKSTPSVEGVLELIGGVLKGMGADINAQDIKPCISDIGTVGTEVENAISSFSKESFEGIKNGLHEIAEAFQGVPTAIKECKAAEAETADVFEDAITSFKNPWGLVYHLGKSILLNGHEIFDDVSGAMQAWENSNWEQCGLKIGEAMFAVLGNDGNSDIVPVGKEILDIFLGIVAGIAHDFGFDSIDACITDVDKSVQDFIDAVKNFKRKDIRGIIDGLKDTANGVRSLPNDIRECAKAAKDAEKVAANIEKAVAAFTDPIYLAWHVTTTLILNGREIGEEIFTAVYDWETKDFYHFGYYIGEAMFKIL
uniref:Uncharacterized protein n=1 Tax=Fabrea salina TaxID=342563 RepID=A0A7S3IAK2_9CILI|mmetsp:Transcript_786/g.1242  ORF Transcript_786/g.1242 Transcript_786/m.1242 type:complete len:329 (+) Transcript_786:79-1065(+)